MPRYAKTTRKEFDPDACKSFVYFIMAAIGARNPNNLCAKLNLDAGQVSRILKGREGVSLRFIVAAHLHTGMPLKRLIEMSRYDGMFGFMNPTEDTPSLAALTAQVKALESYFIGADRQLHVGAISLKNAYVRLEDVLDLLNPNKEKVPCPQA